MKFAATHLRGRRYAIRPEGQLGTCGWWPKPWIVEYVNARSQAEADVIARKRSENDEKDR